MIRKLENWVIGIVLHLQALWARAIAASIESPIFQIPTDVLMLAREETIC